VIPARLGGDDRLACCVRRDNAGRRVRDGADARHACASLSCAALELAGTLGGDRRQHFVVLAAGQKIDMRRTASSENGARGIRQRHTQRLDAPADTGGTA